MNSKSLSALGLVMWSATHSHSMAVAKEDLKLVVIVSEKLELEEVSIATLRRTFTAEPTETGAGGRFVPLNLPPGSAARVAFDTVVLDLSPDQMPVFWVDQRIRGRGRPPRSIPDPQLIVQLVKKVPGAIAYVPAKYVSPGVRVLSIEGKDPGELGYPLP